MHGAYSMHSRRAFCIALLVGGNIIAFLALLVVGSVKVPLGDILTALVGGEPSRPVFIKILFDARLPKALTCILVGSGFAICGAQMQTLFRNPLADPYVLGVSSGAALGAALLILGAGGLSVVNSVPVLRQFGITGASIAGALGVLSIVMYLARRVSSPATILVAGVMFGFLTGAVVDVLVYYSRPEELALFTGFVRGTVRTTGWSDMPMLTLLWASTIVVGFSIAKPLNILLLGDRYAETMGIPVRIVQFVSLGSVGIMAGVTTAYCGVIGFIGLAAPHLVRGLFQTNDHRLVLPGSAAMGSILVMVSELAAQGPGGATMSLPINSVTALIGVPVVLWVLIGRRRSIGMS